VATASNTRPVLIAQIVELLILCLRHVILILVKMVGIVMMENVLAPFTVKENDVKNAGDATLIHAKMEVLVTKVTVIVHQTLLDQNVNF